MIKFNKDGTIQYYDKNGTEITEEVLRNFSKIL